MVTLTIVYDNRSLRSDLIPDWGFSCLVEAHDRKILFDTGASGRILLHNMERLNIDPGVVDGVFLSHPHFDHTGGLSAFLDVHATGVYIPDCMPVPAGAEGAACTIKAPAEIFPGIFSTGELARFEQSLIVRLDEGIAVIAGCSHPGVGAILARASERGAVKALIGGFHGFEDYEHLRDLDVICPAHCTVHAAEIRALYPEKSLDGGVGRVIRLPG